MKKRLAGLDFGLARTGVAISDERKILATPIGIAYTQKTYETTATEIEKMLRPFLPLEKIVIGFPLLLNGKESPLCAHVKQLGKFLEELLSIPILFWDERLSTAQVERTLKEGGYKRKERAGMIDAQTAAAILQNYLDFSKT